MKRFEIFTVDLDPTIGAEMNKKRPCVIVSPNAMNAFVKTVMIAPMTTKEHNIPTRINIEATSRSGLTANSFAALDQIQTVDKSRLERRLGSISESEAVQITETLCEVFSFGDDSF